MAMPSCPARRLGRACCTEDALALHARGRPAGRTGRGPLRARAAPAPQGRPLDAGALPRPAGARRCRALRLIGTHQDLSERHRAEQSLRESEDKLRSLFELSPLGIAMCTMEGRLVEFNEAYRALLGFAPPRCSA
jgi:PAS domain-containing protein